MAMHYEATSVRNARKKAALSQRAVEKLSRIRVDGKVPPMPEPLPDSILIDLYGLKSHHCRWPFGDVKASGVLYCGEAKAGEGPYCSVHKGLARRKVIATD